MEKQKQNSEDVTTASPIIHDDQLNKRVHEHLNNEKDVISESDIANAKTNLSVDNSDPIPETNQQQKDEEAIKKQTIKDNTDPSINTTWNILES